MLQEAADLAQHLFSLLDKIDVRSPIWSLALVTTARWHPLGGWHCLLVSGHTVLTASFWEGRLVVAAVAVEVVLEVAVE